MKGCVVLGHGNSGKRCNFKYKKSNNQGGKRVWLTKAAAKYQIYKDAMHCPDIIIKEEVLKVELKIKYMKKEEVIKERKVICEKMNSDKNKTVSIFSIDDKIHINK